MATTSSTSSTAGATAFNGRLTGLASGLDTDSIVKSLMSAKRIPYDNLSKQLQLVQWKETSYRDLNTKLLDLKNTTFNMKLSSAYRAYTAGSSNDSIVSATATSAASPTAYIFNSITSLAKTSNLATADGQSISRKTSVVTGGVIKMPINTTNNNTFKISLDGGAFVDITLDTGKVYNSTTPGGTYEDLVNDIQTKVNTALGNGNVIVSLNSSNQIMFTSNDTVANGTPKKIVLQQGNSNDLLSGSLGFVTDNTTKQVSSTSQNMDLSATIYQELQQHRYKNTENFDWIVNGSDRQTMASDADNFTSTVDYNNTNLNNYYVFATENQSTTVSSATDNLTTTLNYNGANASGVNVYVNGVKYTTVTSGKASDLKDNEVLVASDSTDPNSGKVKLIFGKQLAANDNVQVDTKTRYTVVTDKIQAELGPSEVLLSDDGTGKAKLTFKNQLAAGTTLSVDRHDFSMSISSYNQNGDQTSSTFNVNAYGETMNSLVNRISTDTNAGVSVFYDTGTDKLVFNADQTGKNNNAGNDISVSGSFLTNALQLTKYQDGSDAVFSINGLDTTRKSNSFTISGVTFNLKSTTSQETNITISQDVDTVFKNIKSFIDAYNTAIGAVNTKLSEKKDYDYTPLTDDQKAQMTEDQIKKWEDQAKSGILSNDPLLGRIVDGMRSAFYDTVSNVSDTKYNSLVKIGITTSFVYTDGGKLQIDESKLKAAIADDPNAVMQLFTSASTSTDSKTKYNETGLTSRIYDNLTSGINDLTTLAGQDNSSYLLYDTSTMGEQISDIKTKMSDMEDMLKEQETNYYNQYANLESYISQMNSQSQWLSKQFG